MVRARNSPAASPALPHPAEAPGAEIKEHEQQACRESQALPDMAQDVMPHLVSEIRKDFRNGFLDDVRVPDYNSLRSAEAADVGVHRIRFFARLHPEHALGRNREACSLHHSFNLHDELRIFLAERSECEKHRLDYKRLDKSEEHDNRQRDQPEIKPPAPWAAPDHHVEYPHSENAAHNQEELRLGIVQRPGAPALHRDAIGQRYPVLVSAGGELQDRDRQDQERRENKSLDETIG